MNGTAAGHPSEVHLHRHPGRPGRFDETARRLSHEEFAVARLLVGEGHDVRSLPEGRALGRTADLEVCGTATEVKTLRVGATSWTLENQLHRAVGQGAAVIVDARYSGLARRWAHRGVERFAGRGAWAGALVGVRVLADGYELAYGCRDLTLLRRAYRGFPALEPGEQTGAHG